MTHRCPATIPRGRWRELWVDCLRAFGDPTRAEVRLIERMILNLMAAHDALASAAKDPAVTGSQGQPVEHPGFKIAARCDTQALSIARQLQLTPLARSSGSSNQGPPKEKDPFEALESADDLATARKRRGKA